MDIRLIFIVIPLLVTEKENTQKLLPALEK